MGRAAAGAAPRRVLSIDALRGFDMFWIAGGSDAVLEFFKWRSHRLPAAVERQFDHVEWEGFVAYDLIMPLFLFIVGVAMPFSFAKRLRSGSSTLEIYRKVAYRVAVLWVLGMVVQGNLLQLDPHDLELYSNTLQAIAAGYLIAAVALVHLRVRGQAVLAGGLLLVYWALMALVPFPGRGPAMTPDSNLALWIDKAVLGRFQDGTAYTWILSSLGFGATVLLGVLAGHVLRGRQSGHAKVRWLAVSGLACLAVGWLWSFSFPIIKHIWTGSMVLWSGGWCLLLLAFFYGVIDVLGYRRWAVFFTVFGMNSIVAYMAPFLVPLGAISKTLFAGLGRHLGAGNDALLACGSVGLLWAGLYYLHRKGTYIRI